MGGTWWVAPGGWHLLGGAWWVAPGGWHLVGGTWWVVTNALLMNLPQQHHVEDRQAQVGLAPMMAVSSSCFYPLPLTRHLLSGPWWVAPGGWHLVGSTWWGGPWLVAPGGWHLVVAPGWWHLAGGTW